MLTSALQTVLRVVYPPRCLSCGGLVDSDFGLCGACWRDTPFIAGLVCDTCGAPLPGSSDRAEACDDCLRTPRPWSQGRAALEYRDRGRRLVMALKHGDRQDIARPAAAWMARASLCLRREDMIAVPVPLHLSRLLRRRYNQSAILAAGLAEAMGIDLCPDALLRPKATPALEGKSRDARFAAVSGRLRPNPRRIHRIKGRSVLLVDDVMTSGATLAAAAEAALEAGASEVCVSVLARVTRDA